MSTELQFLKDVISIILGIVYIFTHPLRYLRNRYNGAQERKNKFYEPLIKDINTIIKDLKECNIPTKPKGLENEHLSLLISSQTRSKMKKLIEMLDEMQEAYNELRDYIYPQILQKYIVNELKEVERKYFIGLGIILPGERFEFIQRLEREPTIYYFLRCVENNESAKLSDLPTFQDLLPNIERAHVNHEFESLLNRILAYLKSSFAFRKVSELQKYALELSTATYKLLENEVNRLSSKILGVIYGSGNLQILNNYIERRESSERKFLRS